MSKPSRRTIAVLAILTVAAATLVAGQPAQSEPPDTIPAASAYTCTDTCTPAFDAAEEARRLRAESINRANNLASRAGRVAEVDARASRTTPPTPAAQPKKPATRKPPAPKPPKAKPQPPVQASGNLGAVVAYARAQVGKRYVFATAGPSSFDCSGLARASYLRIGISLPHQTGALAGRGRAVSRAQLQPGDLVFPDAGHVGIYVGSGQMVHASNSQPYPRGGVKLSTIYRFAFARRLVG